jgi:hypothetical protein
MKTVWFGLVLVVSRLKACPLPFMSLKYSFRIDR